MPADYTAPAPGSTDWDTTLNAALAAIADHVPQVTAFTSIVANTSAIGSTETAVVTLASVPFVNGRAYEFRLATLLQQSAATGVCRVQIHSTNAAGTLLINYFDVLSAGAAVNQPIDWGRILVRTAGSNLTTNIVVTLFRSAGTCAFTATGTTATGFFMIRDIGPAASYPDMHTIT